jgi:hypothetical protein
MILGQTISGGADKLSAQSQLDEIFFARDLIAKAQTAYDVYKAFGNHGLMDEMHGIAEEARAKLKAYGVDALHYEAGKDLSRYFRDSAIKACAYDPSLLNGQRKPLPANENYLFLLMQAMSKDAKGDWAKSQLTSIHATMGTSGEVKTYEAFWQQGEDYFNRFWWQDEEKVDATIRALREEVAAKGKISLPEITDQNWMAGFQRISGALTKKQWDPSTNDVLQTIMTKYGIEEGNNWELTPKKLEAIIDLLRSLVSACAYSIPSIVYSASLPVAALE